ncbi:TetR/AcrR family transcriptional regulator [Peptostreptococcaceae bacterium AGR-M142]
MAKISAIEKEETRKKIKEVSREVFREYGFKDAQIKMIAKRVGIGVSTVYGYFESKLDLFVQSFLLPDKVDYISDEAIEISLEKGLIKGLMEVVQNAMYLNFKEDAELLRAFFMATMLNVSNEKFCSDKIYNKSSKIDIIGRVLEIYERKNKRLCAFSVKNLSEVIMSVFAHSALEFVIMGEDCNQNDIKLEDYLKVIFAGKYEKY